MKHRYVIILAANSSEAHTYARRSGLSSFTYRVPASASSIRKLQVADVHVLPGFARRPDRHSLLAELRYGRDIVFIDAEMPPAPARDQGDGMGEQLTIDDVLGRRRDWFRETPESLAALERERAEVEVAEVDGGPRLDVAATVALVREANPELADAIEASNPEEDASGSTPGTTESREDAAPATPRRRRTRCAGCGELTFETHDHSADPAATADIF